MFPCSINLHNGFSKIVSAKKLGGILTSDALYILLMIKRIYVLMCFQDLSDPRFFANYSLMVILIEKLITEMNLDIYRVIEFIFST